MASLKTYHSLSHAKAEALKKHIDDQLEFYGDIYLVNLVNQKGYEKPVKDAFELAIDRLNEPRGSSRRLDFLLPLLAD